jgi:preprotein translocase subunit SecE
MYIQKDILPKYPEVKVDKANSIINKTDDKTYYLVTNPNKIETRKQSDSLFKASSTRGLTPDEKLEQKRKREQLIQKFKDELEKLGNPSKSELIKNNINLYNRINNSDLMYVIFPKTSPEEKREELIQKFKDELEKLGNPSKSELRKNDINLYKYIHKYDLIDYFFPESSPEEKREELIQKFKDELEKLGNPTKSELIKNYDYLYKRMYRANLYDYFFPELTPEKKREEFKNKLKKLGNPSRSELYKKYNYLYKRMYRAGMLDYFFPKET